MPVQFNCCGVQLNLLVQIGIEPPADSLVDQEELAVGDGSDPDYQGILINVFMPPASRKPKIRFSIMVENTVEDLNLILDTIIEWYLKHA